jgi:uncharacterized protein
MSRVPLLIAGGAIIAGLMYMRRRRGSPATISRIVIYPIKGCRGIEVQECEVTEKGLTGDRQFAIVYTDKRSESGAHTAVSQSNCPRMSLIRPEVVADGLRVRDNKGGVLEIRLKTIGDKLITKVYGNEVGLIDQGDEAAEWFSNTLGITCRLGWVSPGKHRLKLKTGEWLENGLNYKSNILLLSQDSLDALSRESNIQVSYNRFRPNIVISGCGAYAEDHCVAVNTVDGTLSLEGFCLCVRCTYPGVDQDTGILDTKTVGLFRRLRNVNRISFNQRYKTDSWNPQDYLMGNYVVPHPHDGKANVHLGQHVSVIYYSLVGVVSVTHNMHS